MQAHPLHIVFSKSAAVSLREALQMAGKPGGVVALNDDLSNGPMDSTEIEARVAFHEDVIGYDWEEDQAVENARFWERSLDLSNPRIVWVSRWSTLEYCGFLEWLSRNGDAPFEVVDVTDASVPDWRDKTKWRPVACTSLINAQSFIDAELWAQARRPTDEEIRTWRDLWRRLRAENAPLRVITEKGLESAPLTHFDGDILQHIGATWIESRYVIGQVLAGMMLDSFRSAGVFQSGDMLLFSRLRILVARGLLQSRGDVMEASFEVKK